MTIADAAITAMKTENRPMHLNEIYDAITNQGLYTFGAADTFIFADESHGGRKFFLAVLIVQGEGLYIQ